MDLWMFAGMLLLFQCVSSLTRSPPPQSLGRDGRQGRGSLLGRVQELEHELDQSLIAPGLASWVALPPHPSAVGEARDPTGRAGSSPAQLAGQTRVRRQKLEGNTPATRHLDDLVVRGARSVQAPWPASQPRIAALKEDLTLPGTPRVSLNRLHVGVNLRYKLSLSCAPDSVLSAENSSKLTTKAPSELPACPSFQRCTVTRFTPQTEVLTPWGSIDVCSSGVRDHFAATVLSPARNCRSWFSLTAEEKRRLLQPTRVPGPWGWFKGEKAVDVQLLSTNPKLGCGDSADFTTLHPVEFSLYRLKNVYITPKGVVLNSSLAFDPAGCDPHWRPAPLAYSSGKQEVKVVREVMNWVYMAATGFYHFMVEAFPALYVMAPVLHHRRRLPIVTSDRQIKYYKLVSPLVGVPLSRIPLYEMRLPAADRAGDLFHADTVYQPQYQNCAQGSKGLWTELRRRHLLHPDGIPMFQPDWGPRPTTLLTDEEMAKLPDDWVVVVAQRPGTRRTVTGMREIGEAIKVVFPPGRVVVFKGDVGILEARSLFLRARLFVGGHGSALSNMIFMPVGGHVLEIRPDGPLPAGSCYIRLADACSLQYSIVWGKGNGTGPTTVDAEEVLRSVREIAELF